MTSNSLIANTTASSCNGIIARPAAHGCAVLAPPDHRLRAAVWGRVLELTHGGHGLQVLQAVHPVVGCSFSSRTARAAFTLFRGMGLTEDPDFSSGGRHVVGIYLLLGLRTFQRDADGVPITHGVISSSSFVWRAAAGRLVSGQRRLPTPEKRAESGGNVSVTAVG